MTIVSSDSGQASGERTRSREAASLIGVTHWGHSLGCGSLLELDGHPGRLGRSSWSTAVMSTHWVNCSSSRSHWASSSHSAGPMWRTGWPWECSATAAGNRSTAAASTSSPTGTALSRPGSLCVVSRAASSDISEWWGAAWSRRLGDGLVDVDGGALTGSAHDLTGGDEFVQREDAGDEGLGTGGTSGPVDVDGHDLVDAW